jgi:uncharacterized protein involved in exopolysaccharide biosynthesis
MNPDYARTFDRHRLLFILPVVLTTVIALLFTVGAPKVYQAETTLFVDTAPPGQSSFDQSNPTVITPAAQAQQLLNELLATRGFRLAVGERGGLTKYLADHSASGWSPKGLLDSLRGKQPLANRVVSALDATHVTTSLPGGQILAISFKGPEPAVAANTLRALVDQLASTRARFAVRREEGAVAFFQGQVDVARAALGSATSAGEASTASKRLAAATRSLNQTRLNLAAMKLQKGSFDVQDQAKPPTGPVAGNKKILFAMVAGLFVGGLLSFLGIVVLSGRETRAPVVARRPELVDDGNEPPWVTRASEYGMNGGSHEGPHEVEKPAAKADQAGD